MSQSLLGFLGVVFVNQLQLCTAFKGVPYGALAESNVKKVVRLRDINYRLAHDFFMRIPDCGRKNLDFGALGVFFQNWMAKYACNIVTGKQNTQSTKIKK